MRHATRRRATARRSGFTLIELLVVIAIIAILISLGTAAVMKTRVVQETRNTRTLITKVDQAFQKRWISVVETARNEAPCPVAQQWAGGDPARAKVIHIKMRLIQEFPVNFAEATSNVGAAPALGGLAPNPTYTRAFASGANGRSLQDQSAACLYMALKRQGRGIEFDPDTALSSQEILDPKGDGIKEIVDSWKQPLLFVRFPGFNRTASGGADTTPLLGTLLQLRGGAQPYPPSFDPVDQEGTLANTPWVNTLSAPFQANVHPVAAGKTFTLTPVILSSGVDGKNWTGDDITNVALSNQ